jgi:hypothetical protein
MYAQESQNPVLVGCLITGNAVEWAVMHSADTEGETFEGMSFEGEGVTMYTDTGREVIFPESLYLTYGEPASCSLHMIREFDSCGAMLREYQISPPVIAQVPGYGR